MRHTVNIDSKVKDVFDHILVGGFRAGNLKRAVANLDPDLLLKEACLSMQKSGMDTEGLSKHPLIEGWRQGYKLMKVKPSKFRSSIEALARRSLRGDAVETPVKLVNTYNAISLKHIAPLGVYDVSKLRSDCITMRFADPNQDTFVPLGADPSSFPLDSELVVYAADREILCWGFNCRDSKKACLDNVTDEALFFTECAMAVHHDAAVKVLEDLAGVLQEAGAECGPLQYISDPTQRMYL